MLPFSRILRPLFCRLLTFTAALSCPGVIRADELAPAPAGSAPAPARFSFTQAPLQPEFWPAWQEPVNRDRVYDFYAKQAEWLLAKPAAQRPPLLMEYPGLDGGKFGHWGNQNETTWKDGRWSTNDLGRVTAGVLRGGGKTITKAVCVLLGENNELACCFDPETLTYPLVWKGGFVEYAEFRHGIAQNVKIKGTVLPVDPGAPAHNFVYHGYYRNGSRVIFSYRRDGVEILDSAWVKDSEFVREVGPADSSPLAALTQGGPAQWPQALETRGVRGTTEPFAVDTLTLPIQNPWKSLFFVGGHDFLPNGDGVICTIMGEVWTVSGLDDTLEHLRWRRIATGLNQPLGLRVIDGAIYVLGRDQITRLHDLNGDGETDFYECVSNVYKSSSGAHDFITGLERDASGDWYSVSANQGIFRISPDGKNFEGIADGFRNPNGVAVAVDGTVVTSCQEGDWTPASQLCLVPPGARGLFFGFGGPRADRPTTQPLLYLPRGADNSTGGPCFVDSDHWGVPRGSLISTSWGTGSAFLIVREKVDDVRQAAAIQLPGEFRSGAHRARFNPRDGQLYVSGCQGWGSYTPDDGCFQRLRWTGTPAQLPTEIQARDNGVLIRFAQALDRNAVSDAQQQIAEMWNYRYSKAYGSPEFSLRNPGVPGHDLLEVISAHLLPDDKTLFLEIPQLQPCNQLYLHVHLSANHAMDIYDTPHKLGPAFTDFPDHHAIAKIPLPTATPATGLPTSPNPWATGKPGRPIRIETATGMQFATKRFSVKAGERLSLTLTNPDTMPHNLAIIKPGTMAKVGDGVNHMAALPDGAAKRYIPEGGDVLFFTDITDPGKSSTIHFDAPAVPGEYPYICTFPGHWLLMNGVMVVE